MIVSSKETIVRVYVVYISMLVFALLVFGQIINVQVFQRAELQVQADELTVDWKVVTAPRGNIYADHEEKTSLALSVPRYEIRLDLVAPSADVFAENVVALSDSLGKLFDVRTSAEWEFYLRKARLDSNRYCKIKSHVRNDQLERLKTFPILKLGKYKGGFISQKSNNRVLPYGDLAKRTVGYSKVIDVLKGDSVVKKHLKVGIEGAYHEYLQGREGRVLMQKVRGSSDWRPIDSELARESVSGKDVYTTIDVELQDVAHSALLRQMENQQAIRGCVVVMEVETGYVKAITNLSKVGPDTAVQFVEDWNHAIGRTSDPGSTFKLASLIRMLEDKKLQITDSIDMDGVYNFYDLSLHDDHPYGRGTVQFAFEKSSNVFSRLVNDSYSSDPQEFIDGLKGMGLGSTLGISLAGEAQPVIKDADDKTFWGTTLAWNAIGYELEITPLQTLALYNAVANNGRLMRPQFVKEIRDGDEIIERYGPEVINSQICSQSTIRDVKQCLEGVVERGTAKNIKARGFKIAGKTGTAKIAENNKYGDKYQASFCGYFPAERPKYSCIVVIQGPTKQIYGAVVSGTVFKEIADKVYAASLQEVKEEEWLVSDMQPYSKHGSRPELEKVMAAIDVPVKDGAADAPWVLTRTGENQVEFQTKKITEGLMPNVKGMGLQDALYVLEKQGLTVRVRGKGIVKNQSVLPGRKIENGQLVTIDLVL